MDKFQTVKSVERLLFVAVIGMIAVGGFCYGHFEGKLPDWQLISLIVTGYVATQIAYRLALNRLLTRLRY